MREVNLKQTWRDGDPYRVEGLPNDIYAIWVDDKHITQFKSDGYVILEKDMFDGLDIGYDDMDKDTNCYKYGELTLMICSKALHEARIEEENKEVSLDAKSMDQLAKQSIASVSRSIGREGVSDRATELKVSEEGIKRPHKIKGMK